MRPNHSGRLGRKPSVSQRIIPWCPFWRPLECFGMTKLFLLATCRQKVRAGSCPSTTKGGRMPSSPWLLAWWRKSKCACGGGLHGRQECRPSGMLRCLTPVGAPTLPPICGCGWNLLVTDRPSGSMKPCFHDPFSSALSSPPPWLSGTHPARTIPFSRLKSQRTMR